MAGDDAAGHTFARRYDKAADAVVNGLGRAVAQLGGTANGLYSMAMNYIHVDADIAASLMHPYQLPDASNPNCDDETNIVRLPTVVGRNNWADNEIIARFWPEGDPDRLRQAASDWDRAAELIARVGDYGQQQVTRVTATCESKAVDTFEANWEKTRQLVNELSTAAKQLSAACSSYAGMIDGLRAHLEHLAEFAAGVGVVGLLGSIVTLGASDAAGAIAESTIAAEAAAAAGAMAAGVSASAEILVLDEAAEIVDAAAARLIPVDASLSSFNAGAGSGLSASATAELTSYMAPAPPGVLGPVPPPIPSQWPDLSPQQQARFRAWMGELQAAGRSELISMPPSSAKQVNDRRFYQMRVAGNREYRLYTTVVNPKTGTQMGMDADGLRPQDGAVIETKYVGQQDSCRSPLRIGNTDNVPDFIYQEQLDSANSEVERYGSAIDDPRNHGLVTHLELDTNDTKAAAYLEAIRLAHDVPGQTRVIP
jgi:uncharacterized protein YukE